MLSSSFASVPSVFIALVLHDDAFWAVSDGTVGGSEIGFQVCEQVRGLVSGFNVALLMIDMSHRTVAAS